MKNYTVLRAKLKIQLPPEALNKHQSIVRIVIGAQNAKPIHQIKTSFASKPSGRGDSYYYYWAGIAQSVLRLIGVRFSVGMGNFLFEIMTRPALEPTQPPIQWILGALSLGIKAPGSETDHSPRSIAEVKECVELCPNSPNTSSWRGA